MLDKAARVLVVDDDPGHRQTLKTILASWGYAADAADDGSKAVEAVKEAPVDLVLMDVRMAVMDGLKALSHVKVYNPAIPVIIMTAYSSVENAVAALKAGAYDYLVKPLDFEVLKLTLERALEHAGLKSENEKLRKRLSNSFDPGAMVGRSKAMEELFSLVAVAAPTETTVLITGESGTGKELVARSIHANSPRADKPLVVVNCAAMPETLLESELFGHEKGAFTGADRRREGRFAQADGSAIFLDEIGEMPASMQARLLRVIQEREIKPVGSDRVRSVDVRILAATNRDLAAEVSAGTFREDLYYRLNVMPIHVPPLRERPEDIPVLAQHFLAKYAEKNRKEAKGFTPQAMDLLVKYPWPGNVRELENAVERAVILMTGQHVTVRELPAPVARSQAAESGGPPPELPDTAPRSLEEAEKQAVKNALAAANGNKSEAARVLGITRKTLHAKLKKWGLG
ncbi:MAG: sigma-54-dependent Fis family transcriptional regulator [Deltaproteobacteria bacterium]|nr:sigma-54-dependent Fis family transcriptional regulator [Deltaproteobacteria bacterium]